MKKIIVEIDGVRHKVVDGWETCDTCSLCNDCYSPVCNAFCDVFNIKSCHFEKEQEEIETKYMGSYKTTTEVYNGKSKSKIKV